MVKVFICYGGNSGRQIGLALHQYFLNHGGITPFLAGRGSNDIAAGQIFQEVIDENLMTAHLMVVICDAKVMYSKYARQEIDVALNEGILVIPFMVNDRRRPDKLKNVWAPIRYNAQNPEISFPDLLTAINNSLMVRITDFFVEGLGTNPNTGIPLRIVRDVRRRR